MDKWTMPDGYWGAEWPEYFVFLGRTRDSDDLTESNFAIGLERLGGESETVQIVRESHWACGWLEWIAIHESDATAIALANEMESALTSYPVLDEDDWTTREDESAKYIWTHCYDDSSRVQYIRDHRSQFDFRNMADLIAVARGRYFNGYASEILS